MGKIQDAIIKVRKSRSVKGTHPDKTPVSQGAGVVPIISSSKIDANSDPDVWNYGGKEFLIDYEKLINGGLLDRNYARKYLTKEYRQIRQSLIAGIQQSDFSAGRRPNLILVGSSNRAEGRSFIALSVAMSIATETDYSVVLVDADFENPKISELIGAPKEPGLADLLASNLPKPTSLIQQTDIAGLAFLSAGQDIARAFELIDSKHTSEIFHSLSKADSRRIFVLDSSPLSTPFARTLNKQVGQTLCVILEGKTSRSAVMETLRYIDNDGSAQLILNQVIDWQR